MTAALPKEEAPRCPDCKQPKCCTAKTRSGCRMMADTCHGGGGCDRVALRLERAAHQKTLDALEAALLASRTKLRQQQGVKAAFSGLAASAASILAAGGRNV